MACNCGKSTPRKWSTRPNKSAGGIRVGARKCPKCSSPMVPRAGKWKCKFCKHEVPR